MRSTPVRHECTRSKVHGERLMISKYGSAVWPPHSAEVYIGFERASSCPRLISPTPIYIPLYIYIYIYIHYTRGFPVNLRVFTVHANYFWQWCHRETGLVQAKITFGKGPGGRDVWNLRGRPRGVRFSIFNARSSTVDVG